MAGSQRAGSPCRQFEPDEFAAHAERLLSAAVTAPAVRTPGKEKQATPRWLSCSGINGWPTGGSSGLVSQTLIRRYG